MGFQQAAETAYPILFVPLVATFIGRLILLRVRSPVAMVLVVGIIVTIFVYGVSVALFYWCWKKSCLSAKRLSPPPWKKICIAAIAPGIAAFLPYIFYAFAKRTMASMNKLGPEVRALNYALDENPGAILVWPTVYATILGGGACFFTSAAITMKC